MFFKLLRESIIFAANSVTINKLRTFLSLFGITIGIFSIISVFTVLDWMEKSIRDSISSLGDNVVYVQKFPWSFDPNLAWWDIIRWPAVSFKDYEAILNKATKAKAACFSAFQPESITYRKNQANDAFVWATTHEFEELRSFEILFPQMYFKKIEYIFIKYFRRFFVWIVTCIWYDFKFSVMNRCF